MEWRKSKNIQQPNDKIAWNWNFIFSHAHIQMKFTWIRHRRSKRMVKKRTIKRQIRFEWPKFRMCTFFFFSTFIGSFNLKLHVLFSKRLNLPENSHPNLFQWHEKTRAIASLEEVSSRVAFLNIYSNYKIKFSIIV